MAWLWNLPLAALSHSTRSIDPLSIVEHTFANDNQKTAILQFADQPTVILLFPPFLKATSDAPCSLSSGCRPRLGCLHHVLEPLSLTLKLALQLFLDPARSQFEETIGLSLRYSSISPSSQGSNVWMISNGIGPETTFCINLFAARRRSTPVWIPCHDPEMCGYP